MWKIICRYEKHPYLCKVLTTKKKQIMKALDIQIKRTSSYGRYIVTGTINGIELTAATTDSEAFDYLNDDDYPEKQAKAIAHCEFLLTEKYDQL